MRWSKETLQQVEHLKPVVETSALYQRIIKLIDFTSLNDNDTQASIALFLDKAQTNLGNVAAVCVYPKFTKLAVDALGHTKIKIATVANFPAGTGSTEDVLITINDALQDGAQEIDVVFPYKRFLAGEKDYASEFVTACKAACGSALLKVILETGAYESEAQIAQAAETAILGGANFVKTSTGKVAQGASLNAAAVLLQVIKKMRKTVGLKVSGGIRTVTQAAQYIELADHLMGKGWVRPETFRIGASQLIEEMLKKPQFSQ